MPHNTCDDTFSSTQRSLREEVENWNCSGQGKQAWESPGGSSEKKVEGNQNSIFERTGFQEGCLLQYPNFSLLEEQLDS